MFTYHAHTEQAGKDGVYEGVKSSAHGRMTDYNGKKKKKKRTSQKIIKETIFWKLTIE